MNYKLNLKHILVFLISIVILHNVSAQCCVIESSSVCTEWDISGWSQAEEFCTALGDDPNITTQWSNLPCSEFNYTGSAQCVDGFSKIACGDSKCEGPESCGSCPQDCGVCSVPQEYSGSSGSKGGGGGGGGGGSPTLGTSTNVLAKISKYWSSIPAGTHIIIPINNSNIAFTEVSFDAKSKASNVDMGVYSLRTIPAGVKMEINKEQYQYLEVKSINLKDTDISNVKIKFKIPSKWLGDKGISSETIAISKYKNDKWVELLMNSIKKDENYYYFEAETEGFSLFSVNGIKTSASSTWDIMDTISQYYEKNIGNVWEIMDKINKYYEGK